MLETIDGFMDWLQITGTDHPGVFAIVLGMLISMLLTQMIKGVLPKALFARFNGHDLVYYASMRGLAFVIAFTTAWHMMPDGHRFSLEAALLAGAGAPTFYKVLVTLLYKRFPSLEAALSGRPPDDG